MLEREAKREKTLETTAREKRLKAQQKPPRKVIVDPIEKILKTAEDEFNAAISAVDDQNN
jgi:dynein intermediate chain 2